MQKASQHQKKAEELTLTPSDLYDELMQVDVSLQGLSSSAHASAHSAGPTRQEGEVVLSEVTFAKGVSIRADSSTMLFMSVVQFEAPLDSYTSMPVLNDIQPDDEVEGWLPTLASLRLAELSDESNYGEHPESTPSEEETTVNHRLQLNKDKKINPRTQHEATWQAKVNLDWVEQAIGRIPDRLGVFIDSRSVEQSN